MKYFKYLLILCMLLFFFSSAGFSTAGSGTAVVKSRFDNIELVLQNYHIPYDLIDYKDLDSEETFLKYDSIFFPSGISAHYENNVNVEWQGKDIRSVSLSKDFFELNINRFSANLRNFTTRGGSSYFSGYSYKFLNNVYNVFEFFYDFPYMGIPGRIEASVRNDLASFSLKKKAALYMEYTGWIALKNVKGAEILSESHFPTPRGEKFGPISVLLKKGDGEILYTSYYSTVYSEFKRFNIYRVAGNRTWRQLTSIIEKGFQKISGKITDAFLNNESSRTYFFNLHEGNNTIYFLSEAAPYMFEIYDSDMSLIASVDRQELFQSYDILSRKEDYCFVKIYPSVKERFKIYSIISAKGSAMTPAVKIALKISIAIIGLIFLAAFVKVMYSRLK